MCWGCLRFLFRPCLPRFAVVIFPLQSTDCANLGDLSARGGADRTVWRGTVCYSWGIHGEFGTTWVSKPALFNTLVYFQRAHPPFVFYFTATFISFSYCLIRARSPVEIQSLLIPYILLFCFFAERCSYLMALYRDLSYFSRDFIVYFRRALALLDGAISGIVVLEISLSTQREVV